jgi:hypothetical protein
VTTRPASGWLAGVVLGTASGFLVIELGVIGLAFVLVSIGLIAWKGPRLAAFGGLLAGFGGLWTVLIGRVALTCGADAFLPDPNCMTDDLTSWVAGSGLLFLAGLVVSAFGLWRRRR